jgi:hypothetical protein
MLRRAKQPFRSRFASAVLWTAHASLRSASCIFAVSLLGYLEGNPTGSAKTQYLKVRQVKLGAEKTLLTTPNLVALKLV